MKRMFSYTRTLTCNASGDVTAYFGHSIRGRVHAIKYLFGNIDATADFTITGETTGIPILAYTDVPAADAWWYPRALANKNTNGAAFTDALADICVGTAEVGERIKVVIAEGGNVQAGTMTIFVEEDQ